MNDETLMWLLEEDNPPVRFLSLTNLLGMNETCREVLDAKESLMDYEVTKMILKQSEKFWRDDEKAYWKYTGKYWQVIFLGQFLADGNDPRISDGVLEIIENKKWIHNRGGQCLTANMLAAFIRLGFYGHPVVKEELEILASRYLDDKGVDCEVMNFSLLERCHMSTPKLLLCFGLVPEKQRSDNVREAICRISDGLISKEVYNYVPGHNREWQVILENAPHRADLPKGQTVKNWIGEKKEDFLFTKGPGTLKPKPGWVRFGFPLHYNSDILEAMYALAMVDVPMSEKLVKPLQIIREKEIEGKWILENSLNGKMHADVEEKGKSSKWITYFTMQVLKHFGN